MTKEEAVRQLNEISIGDPEFAHHQADAVLLLFLKENGFEDIADAWRDADDRAGFWYA